jgi:signal transduction histidine kinase
LPHVRRRAIAQTLADDTAMVEDFVTAWYRIELPPTTDSRSQALYLPRWGTWGRLAVYADDRLIYRSDEERMLASFNQAQLVRLPPASAPNGPDGARPRTVTIRMDGARVAGGMLSSVWVGSSAEIEAKFAARRWLEAGVAQVSSAALLALGIFALCLWLVRRRETSLLLFFVLTALYFVRNLHFVVDNRVLSERWLGWLVVYSQGWLVVVTYLLALHFVGARRKLVEKLLIGFMVALTVATMPLTEVQRGAVVLGSVAYVLFAAIRLGAAVSLSIDSARLRSVEGALLAGALWLTIVWGVHDYRIFVGATNPEGVSLASFGSITLFAVFLVALLRRYIAALTTAEQSNVTLQSTLAERERELATSYEQLRGVERAQLLSEERQRLMREMHDGLGSALMSSLVAVERGQMPPAEIAQVLRECVDDLKLTIDSLEPTGDDLLILLATLRYRLEPRLQAAGIELEWGVQSVPTIPWLNPAAALSILRMLQEVLTNVLKHARATSISVSTACADGHVAVIVEDDGVGFDPQRIDRPGRGLDNLRRRARALGGVVDIASVRGATRVCIRLPLDPAAASAPVTA